MKRLECVLLGIVLALCPECGNGQQSGADGGPGLSTVVAEDQLPERLTLTLSASPDDAGSPRVVRTLIAELVSPHHVPLDGLKWPRLEFADGRAWPKGWTLLPGEPPFGVSTNGIPAARRFRWKIEVARDAADAPTTADVFLSIEHRSPNGGGTVKAKSNPVQIEFPAE